MFLKPTKPADTKFDKAIDSVLSDMTHVSSHSKEYVLMVDQLTKLTAMKVCDTEDRVSRDTLAIIAANIFGILLIISYERSHVLASKAVSFLLKPK
jgi:hypothetical protein